MSTTTPGDALRELERQRLLLRLEEEGRLRQAAAEAELCRSSLAEFSRRAWPIIEPHTELEWGRHLDALCLHLDAVARGVITRLLVNVPPGSSKSSFASAIFPAWMWTRRPGWRLLSGSHKLDLATRDTFKSRRIMESEWYRETFRPGWDWTAIQNSYYANSEWGWRLALSVGGGVTGQRGDCILIDDPLDADHAESEYERNACLSWWKSSMANRLNDMRRGARIVVMQRLHDEDLSGYLLEEGGWEHLRLPAEYEADEPCRTSIGWEDWRTEDGELLDPGRFPKAVLEAERSRLGEYGYAGQYSQRPVSRSGGLFAIDNLKVVDAMPA